MKLRILALEALTILAIQLHKIRFPKLVVRKGTTDCFVYRSVFLFHEFKLPIKIKPELIVDGGAYTGFSALYYASKYPTARIICVEPEISNFTMLEKHTEHLPNVIRINAGLWSKETFLRIRDMGNGNWGFAVEEVSGAESYDVKGVTIEKILKESGFDRIDILKLDIEGSEKQLFTENYQAWIDKVNIIVIELHDRIIKGCTEALYSAINKDEWKEFKEGEKVILIRRDYYNVHNRHRMRA